MENRQPPKDLSPTTIFTDAKKRLVPITTSPLIPNRWRGIISQSLGQTRLLGPEEWREHRRRASILPSNASDEEVDQSSQNTRGTLTFDDTIPNSPINILIRSQYYEEHPEDSSSCWRVITEEIAHSTGLRYPITNLATMPAQSLYYLPYRDKEDLLDKLATIEPQTSQSTLSAADVNIRRLGFKTEYVTPSQKVIPEIGKNLEESRAAIMATFLELIVLGAEAKPYGSAAEQFITAVKNLSKTIVIHPEEFHREGRALPFLHETFNFLALNPALLKDQAHALVQNLTSDLDTFYARSTQTQFATFKKFVNSWRW